MLRQNDGGEAWVTFGVTSRVTFWVTLGYFPSIQACLPKGNMKRTYFHKEEHRARFWIRTPKTLWDWLPKIIARDLKAPDTDANIGSRCQACGERLRILFGRAVRGMVDRTILRELVNEICNEELYRNTPTPEIVEIRQPIPTQSDLLQGFLSQVLRSLHIDLNLPQNPKSAQPQPEPAAVPVCAQSPRLLDLCELYLKEKESGGNVNPKTEKDRRNALSLLVEYLGEDFEVSRFHRALMIDLRTDLLKKYPLHRKKLYPGMPLKEVLKLKNVKAYISETTITRYWEFWNGFFNWAVQADYLAKNPATGLSDRSALYDVRELRPPFTTQELTSIFTMIADLPNRPRFMTKLYPMRYWVNLLALYQGMRLNEICQLYLDDIVMEEGLPCIRIRPDRERKQKVKNKSSIRTIPIHSTILRLGFLDYCRRVREESGTSNCVLFPPATALDGGYQRKMQQFNALIHSLPGMDPRKSIHSYRHNFDTELLNKGAQEYFILCLDGHTRTGELMSRYAKPEIRRLHETLELVTYDGFDVFRCLGQQPLSDEAVAEQARIFFLS